MSKFKVGDRVRLSKTGRSDFSPSTRNPHGMYGIIGATFNHESRYFGIHVTWDNGVNNAYAPDHLEPLPTRTLTVGETYTTKSGKKLACIFILDDVAFMRFDHGYGVTGEAYRYNLDGTSISHGAFPDEYDIKFEPVVEWVDGRLNYDPSCCSDRIFYGEHDTLGQNLTVRFPLIDGEPDWSQATVTEA